MKPVTLRHFDDEGNAGLFCRAVLVLWIRIVFNADPDPGSQTNADLADVADPDPGQILSHKKLNFCMKNTV
jgi:hypothetical protein